MTDTPFEGFAVVEMMGHATVAGYVTETTVAGAGFIHVAIPDPDGTVKSTKLCSPQSIYAITPCDEDAARRAANPYAYRSTARELAPLTVNIAEMSDERPEYAAGGRVAGDESYEPWSDDDHATEDDDEDEGFSSRD